MHDNTLNTGCQTEYIAEIRVYVTAIQVQTKPNYLNIDLRTLTLCKLNRVYVLNNIFIVYLTQEMTRQRTLNTVLPPSIFQKSPKVHSYIVSLCCMNGCLLAMTERP